MHADGHAKCLQLTVAAHCMAARLPLTPVCEFVEAAKENTSPFALCAQARVRLLFGKLRHACGRREHAAGPAPDTPRLILTCQASRYLLVSARRAFGAWGANARVLSSLCVQSVHGTNVKHRALLSTSLQWAARRSGAAVGRGLNLAKQTADQHKARASPHIFRVGWEHTR